MIKFEHAACEWEHVGQCVYCKEHGDRLYQGTLPKSDADRRATVEFFEKELNHPPDPRRPERSDGTTVLSALDHEPDAILTAHVDAVDPDTPIPDWLTLVAALVAGYTNGDHVGIALAYREAGPKTVVRASFELFEIAVACLRDKWERDHG